MRIDTRDLAAIILAGGVSLAVVALAIGMAVHPLNISAADTALLAAVLGAAVGGLTTFLGFRARSDGAHNTHNQIDPYEHARTESSSVRTLPPPQTPPPGTPYS